MIALIALIAGSYVSVGVVVTALNVVSGTCAGQQIKGIVKQHGFEIDKLFFHVVLKWPVTLVGLKSSCTGCFFKGLIALFGVIVLAGRMFYVGHS